MDEVNNPYRPGAGTSPPALPGRDELIDHFGRTLRRARARRPGKSIMPIGLRGVGKTVLLNRFTEIAEREGFSVGFIEARESGDFVSLLANRVRKILLALDNERRTAKVLKALRVLKTFSLQLPDGARIALDVDALAGAADSGDLAEDITDLLVTAGEAAMERSSGILLAVDEVQYLTAAELGALITAVHRATQRDLPVVVVGAGLPQLPGLAREAKSYAERLFEFPEIGSLTVADATAAIVVPANELGVDFADDAVDMIVGASRGYPYFLQEWGYHTWNAADSSPIKRRVVETVTPRVVSHLDDNFFLVRFDRLTPKEKSYLRAMAELGPGPHRSGDIAARLGVRVESVGPRRSALIAKGMIYSPAHGDTAFTVPLFDEFLKRTIPDEV
ncbi:MAG: ATP-binding protein [Acidimicrobiia bacterium]|nr:ATP-binding protein [Acidimicrobiia bacterium]